MVQTAGLEELAKLLKELPGRCEALKRYAVSEVAKVAQGGIAAKEPDDEDLPAYADKLQVAMVIGRKASYGVLYFGKPIPLRDHNPEKTLLYIKPVDQDRSSPDAFLFSVLAQFQPFAVSMFPSDVPLHKAFVVARKVSEREVRLVKERNMKERVRIAAMIKKYNLRIKLDPIKIDDVETVTDTMFTVLRKEFGVGFSKKPHWRPGIKLAASNSALKGIIASKVVTRILSGRYRGWEKLGMLSVKVTEQDVKSIEDFQEVILKGM